MSFSRFLPFFLCVIAADAQIVNDATLKAITVTSGRSYAVVQFNMPAVQLWLPRLTNSAYASEEFSNPKILDDKGDEVESKLERGLYDHDMWKNEIRIKTEGNPVRMVGTIHVHYPTAFRQANDGDPSEQLTKPAVFVELPPVFVEQWKDIDISYDLPVIAKHPTQEIGHTPPLPKNISDTPGGRVTQIIRPTPQIKPATN